MVNHGRIVTTIQINRIIIHITETDMDQVHIQIWFYFGITYNSNDSFKFRFHTEPTTTSTTTKPLYPTLYPQHQPFGPTPSAPFAPASPTKFGQSPNLPPPYTPYQQPGTAIIKIIYCKYFKCSIDSFTVIPFRKNVLYFISTSSVPINFTKMQSSFNHFLHRNFVHK